jgi:hypothetical protein
MPPFQQSVDVCSNFDVSGMVLAFTATTTITGHTTHHSHTNHLKLKNTL